MRSERVVVITGAGGGIGSKLVERFLSNADRVVGLDQSQGALETLAASCNSVLLSTEVADVTDRKRLESIGKELEQKHGGVDVLVNCAGFYPTVPFEAMSPSQWQRVLDVNLTGPFNVIQILLPLLKRRGRGRIVNISSASIFEGVVGQTHYVAAKAGLMGFTRSLAMEVGQYGITVNTVAPGLTVTAPVRQGTSPSVLNAQVEARALKRDEQPEDLAGPAFFLCSPDADFMTGQLLVVDGGKTKH